MATPTQRSFTQILTAMIQTFVSKSGVNDLAVGSAIRSFLETAALSDLKTQGDIMSALASLDIDNVKGPDLDKIGTGAGVARPQAKPSNGVITISQDNFVKISTKVYQGTAAPPAGSVALNVADGSAMPTSGSVYIGRGTANLEGPIAYSSIAQVGNYYQITLVTPTTKNHNLGETVILAQGGNRTVSAGASVQTNATLTSSAVVFRVLTAVTLLDGEESISDVPVVCTETGTVGNISAGAVQSFVSAPFPNAIATNPLGFVSGRDTMADDDYRQKIKDNELTKVKATDLAVKQAAIDVQSTDDSKIVTSAEIRSPANRGEPSTLFLDDGTGYPPIFYSQGFEQIIDNANGGEKYLTLQQEDLTKALVISAQQAPFSLTGGMTLSVRVGGLLSEHTFADTDFATANAATTFEVVDSINNNPTLLFSARSVNNEQNISLFAKGFQNEDIKVSAPISGIDANAYLGFSTTLTYSIRLYKNEKLLIKDGVVPTLLSNLQSEWASSVAGGQSIIMAVDGIIQTGIVNDSDFIPYGFATVNKNNSLASWASVLNTKIAGVTFSEDSGALMVVSNKGANNKASLAILGGSLITSGLIFTNGSVSYGQTADYNLNRSTGEIELTTPAVSGDVFSAGSKNTRAFLDSIVLPGGSLNLASSPTPKLWLIVDADAAKVSHASTGGSTITITNPSTNIWRYTSSVTGAFASVQADDIVVVTENPGFSSANVGFWRVTNVGASFFEVRRSTGGVVESVVMTATDDITMTRSAYGEMQQLSLPTGLQTVSALANSITASLIGGYATSVSGNKLRIATNTYSSSEGKMFLAAVNDSSSSLGLSIGVLSTSNISHTAFSESLSQNTFIEFIHDTIATGNSTSPYSPVVSTLNLDSMGFSPNSMLRWLNPYGGAVSSNRQQASQMASLTGTTIGLRANPKLDDIIAGDRYFVQRGYNFDAQDNMVVILDKDTINKTFNVSFGRKGSVYNSGSASTFKAYDADFGPTANWAQSFGNNFNFTDFKIHFNARAVLTPAGVDNSMLIRSVKFGPTGNQIRVGIFYPTAENSAVSSAVTTGYNTNIQLFLSSGALRTGGNWDATTSFDVTNPVGNTWRYTYNGTGTAPNLLSASIVPGDIVYIGPASTFSANNRGAYKVSAVTNIYFEVTKFSGTAETMQTIASSVSLKFYPISTTTALAMGTYINQGLTSYISASQRNTGAGAITTSTMDDSAGAYSYLSLQDGENWISSSSIGTVSGPTNDFVVKKPLNFFGSDLLSEPFYLVPVYAEQINRFLNIFAVTGLSSLGGISAATNATTVQMYSSLFGSSGSVQVSGGTANETVAAVQNTGSLSGSGYVKFAIPLAAERGFHAGQWVKITNNANLAKNLGFNSGTQLSFVGQTPIPNQAEVTIVNSNTGNVHQFGYFQTSRVHNADSTTVMRLEKQGQFVCMSWTGSGTNPLFNSSFSIANMQRSSGVSTLTMSAPHGISVGQALTVEISGASDSSFNGTYRAMASSTTAIQYNQLSLSDVASAASAGSMVRRVYKNDRMLLSGAFTSGNAGEFIVSNVYGDNTIYFENATVEYGDYTLLGNSDIKVLSYDSLRPGDTFSIGTHILDDNTLPVEVRKGSYTVASISSDLQIVLTTVGLSKATGSTSILGSDYSAVTGVESAPFSMYAKLANVSPSPTNVNQTDMIIFGTDLPSKITSAGGSSIETVSKIGFSNAIQEGEDSYKYYGGLIHAVGKVIRGDPSDPVTYPGVAAAGSYIEVDSALRLRIQISLVIRNRTGTPFSVIRGQVQSAVSSYVNSLGVGQPVVFSEIITAAQSINGVQAVSISSPTYNSTNDQIIAQPNQKPIVLSLNTDIIVSLAT